MSKPLITSIFIVHYSDERKVKAKACFSIFYYPMPIWRTVWDMVFVLLCFCSMNSSPFDSTYLVCSTHPTIFLKLGRHILHGLKMSCGLDIILKIQFFFTTAIASRSD